MARNGNPEWLRLCLRHCTAFGRLLMQLFSWLWSTCTRRTAREDEHYGDGSCDVVPSQCQHDISELERRDHSAVLSLSGLAEHVLLSGSGAPPNEGPCVVEIPENNYSYPQQEQPVAIMESSTEVVVLLSDQMKSCVLPGSTSCVSACSVGAAAAIATAPAASTGRNAASGSEVCTPVSESIQPAFPMRKVKSTVATDFNSQLEPINDVLQLENQCALPIASAVSEPEPESLAAAEVGSLGHVSLHAMVSFSVREKNRNASRLGMLAFSSDGCRLGAWTNGPTAVRWPPPRLPQPPPVFEPHSLQPHDDRLPPASPEDGGPIKG